MFENLFSFFLELLPEGLRQNMSNKINTIDVSVGSHKHGK